MTATIELFFSTYSAFAYLGHAQLLRVAAGAKRTIIYRPFDLRALFTATGHPATGGLTQTRRDYFFGREIERWAEHRGVPVLDHIPASHGSDLAASSRMLIAALRAGHDGGALAGEMLRAHWVDGADLANPDHLLAMAARVGLDGSALLHAAADDEIGALYAANTAEAIARGVFGSPTYFVDGDMFYGQDRLELVARACQQPYARHWRGAPA